MIRLTMLMIMTSRVIRIFAFVLMAVMFPHPVVLQPACQVMDMDGRQ